MPGNRKISAGTMLARFSTRDRAVAEQHFAATYGQSMLTTFAPRDADFHLEATVAELGSVRLVKSDAVNLDCIKVTDGFIQLVVPVSSTIRHQTDKASEIIATCEVGVIVRPHQRSRQTVQKGTTLVLSAPIAEVIKRAEVLAGLDYSDALIADVATQFELGRAVPAALVRNMKSALAELINLEAIGVGALAVSGYEELLLNLAAPIIFPSIAGHIQAEKSNVTPATIVRARDFIVEHSAEPIEIGALAKSLGISMRVMQISFQKHYGFSPRDYIFECRLERARELLLAAVRDVTVSTIAFASGFTDLSHFSAKYKDKYGELPSQTLRTARG